MSAINSHNQFYTSSAVATLSLENRDFRSPAAYADSLLRERYENQEVYVRVLNPMAQWAEPGDPMFGRNEGLHAEHAFRRGGVIALRVAEACGKLTLLQDMARIDPLDGPAPSVEKGKWFDNKQGQVYLSLGIAEYTRLGKATDQASLALSSLLKTWTPQVAQEEYAEDFFGMGFGTMAFYGLRALELPIYEKAVTKSLSDEDCAGLFKQ